jgi:hypothetical protein
MYLYVNVTYICSYMCIYTHVYMHIYTYITYPYLSIGPFSDLRFGGNTPFNRPIFNQMMTMMIIMIHKYVYMYIYTLKHTCAHTYKYTYIYTYIPFIRIGVNGLDRHDISRRPIISLNWPAVGLTSITTYK